MTSKKSKNFLFNFFSSSLPILASRILGLVRDLFFAKYLGGTTIADVVLASTKIPNALRRAFGEGAVANSFIPIFSEDLKNKKDKDAKTFASRSYSVLFWFMLTLTAVIEIFMPSVLRVLLPGFANNPEQFKLAIDLSRIVFPFLIFMSLYSFFTSILQSVKRFALAMFVNLILNAIIIATILVYHSSSLIGYYVILAYLVSSMIMFTITKMYSDKKYSEVSLISPLKIRSILKDNKIKLFIKNIIPGLLNTAIIFSGTLFASFYAGAVSWLYYAERLTQFPFGIIGVPLAMILLPYSSKSRSKKERFVYQNKAFELSSLLMIPCALGLVFFGGYISSLVFERGMFSAIDNAQTYKAMILLALGVPFLSYIRIVSTAFYSDKDTKTVFYHTVFSFAISIAIMITLRKYMGYLAIPFASTSSNIILFATLANAAYKRGLFALKSSVVKNTILMLVSGVVMGVSVYYLSNALLSNEWLNIGIFSKVLYVGLVILFGALIYGISLIATGVLNKQFIRSIR